MLPDPSPWLFLPRELGLLILATGLLDTECRLGSSFNAWPFTLSGLILHSKDIRKKDKSKSVALYFFNLCTVFYNMFTRKQPMLQNYIN